MKTAFQLIGGLFIALFLAGCKREINPPAHEQQQKLVDSAKAILSNPSNWKANSSSLAEFIDAAAELNWSDKAEVKDFKLAAEDLVKFGTTWINRLDETESHNFNQGVSHIVGKVDSNLPGAQAAASVQINSDDIEKNAASALGSSTTKLTPEQAEQFGKLFSKAVDCYEKIIKLRTTE